jgi:hypothetical protein
MKNYFFQRTARFLTRCELTKLFTLSEIAWHVAKHKTSSVRFINL